MSGLAEGELSGLRWDDRELDASVPVAHVAKALAVAGAWATGDACTQVHEFSRAILENRTRDLRFTKSENGECERVPKSANMESSTIVNLAVGAGAGTNGADPGTCGKASMLPAVTLSEVIAMLDAGDVSAARAALAALVDGVAP